MAKLVVEDTSLISVANKIRERTETPDKLVFPEGFNSAIDTIKGGAENQELNITSNGTYTAPEGVGYSPVKVNVPQDGAPTAEELTITGNCQYKFAYDGWDWLLEKYGNQMSTKDITDCSSMFYWCQFLHKIPFDLNFSLNARYIPCNSAFEYATGITEIPQFHNCKINGAGSMFKRCFYLKHFPKDWASGFDYSFVDNATNKYDCDWTYIFDDCKSLRELPMDFLKHGNPNVIETYSYYGGSFSGCRALDAIIELPNPYLYVTWTSNAFGGYSPDNFVGDCYHLKDLTFAPKMTNGEPNNPKWSNQTLQLTGYLGYGSRWDDMSQFGLPAEKKIIDDATYQQFKDDPDAWTQLKEYSRYNHDSAVRTINSLPDTSAFIASNGGTNTIKFAGANGSKTDGGAINTLTEAEIAVAAAKGWTVTLV